MKNIFIFTFLLLFSFNTYAFEVYGLKSGMTKTEFYELTDCQAGVDKYNRENSYSTAYLSWCLDSSIRLDYFNDISPTIFYQWTHEEKLWRVSLRHTKRKDILQGIAYKRAIQKAHPGMDILESSSTSQYGTTEFLTVTYIDDSLSESSIDHYVNIYLEDLNNKK